MIKKKRRSIIHSSISRSTSNREEEEKYFEGEICRLSCIHVCQRQHTLAKPMCDYSSSLGVALFSFDMKIV
jgi:hypothetical protein